MLGTRRKDSGRTESDGSTKFVEECNLKWREASPSPFVEFKEFHNALSYSLFPSEIRIVLLVVRSLWIINYNKVLIVSMVGYQRFSKYKGKWHSVEAWEVVTK